MAARYDAKDLVRDAQTQTSVRSGLAKRVLYGPDRNRNARKQAARELRNWRRVRHDAAVALRCIPPYGIYSRNLVRNER
jgi:hypothetical protein